MNPDVRTKWLSLTEDLQSALAAGINSLGGKRYEGLHEAFTFYSAVHINRATVGYVILAKAGHHESAILLVRTALEAMLRLKAVKNQPELVCQIAFSEMIEEKKMMTGIGGPDDKPTLAAIDSHWAEFRARYQRKYPMHVFRESKISLAEIAKAAGLDAVYNTHYRLYCKFTHAALRAAMGGFGEIVVRDVPIVAASTTVAIDALISLGADVHDYADFQHRLAQLDAEDHGG